MTRMYASDASIYEIQPVGVGAPRNTDDVVKLVGYAAGHNLALFPRGGGSGFAGQLPDAGW
ncbi:MAG: FAD-binding protein [Pirellulales bacterium]